MKHFDFHSSGTPLHFLHANGYPAGCYRSLLELLQTNYHVFGMLLRPLWGNSNPEEVGDWHIFSDDLLRFLRDCKTVPVIAVGHSIGATVTLRENPLRGFPYTKKSLCEHNLPPQAYRKSDQAWRAPEQDPFCVDG